MQIFSGFDKSSNVSQRTQRRVQSGKVVAKGKMRKPPRMKLSANEIRDRVAKATAPSKGSKTGKANLSGKPASSLMHEEEALKKAQALGDIKSNDPNDDVTHGKLKHVLSANAFNFSDKERAVLSKILR